MRATVNDTEAKLQAGIHGMDTNESTALLQTIINGQIKSLGVENTRLENEFIESQKVRTVNSLSLYNANVSEIECV